MTEEELNDAVIATRSAIHSLQDYLPADKAMAAYRLCVEAQRLAPYEQLADELAEFAGHVYPCGQHCASEDPAPCTCGLEALLAKHAKLKHGGGAKDGATEGHAADNIDIRPPMR